MISLVTMLGDDEIVETGTVGREGMVGLPAFLGATRSPGRAYCQVPGAGRRMAVERFHALVRHIEPLRTMLLRYANALMAMMAQTAACNRTHAVEARMARWLLMTLDRTDDPELPLTQEFLGQMLGVRRPAVNLAGQALQHAGLIRYSRGKVTVIDRPALEAASCECFAYINRMVAGIHAPDVDPAG